MSRKINGVKIIIETSEEDGTPLNDSPREDRNSILVEEDDGRDMLCTDQLSTLVTLEYLEKRDRLDRMMYSV
jgi:hypothetical protein